eukprot:9080248-Pyramimonas_sp.AAC.1
MLVSGGTISVCPFRTGSRPTRSRKQLKTKGDARTHTNTAKTTKGHARTVEPDPSAARETRMPAYPTLHLSLIHI